MLQLQPGQELTRFITLMFLVPLDDPRDPLCRMGVPVYLEGVPGIGKSVGVAEAARICNLLVETVFPSTRMPEDLNEVLIPDGKGGATMTCAMVQIKSLAEEGSGVLFFDEATLAVLAVLNASMNVVWDRRAGGLRLPGGVRVVLAGNDADSVGGTAFPAALRNRMAIVEVVCPRTDKWIDYMEAKARGEKTALQPIEGLEQLVRDRWDEAFAAATELVVSFIRKFPDKLYEKDDDDEAPAKPGEEKMHRDQAWCSPRSWDTATHALATFAALADQPYFVNGDAGRMQRAIMESIVGRDAAVKFMNHLRHNRVPSVDEVLNGSWKPKSAEPDVARVVIDMLRNHLSKLMLAGHPGDYLVDLYTTAIVMFCDEGLTDVVRPLMQTTQEAIRRCSTATQQRWFTSVRRHFVEAKAT